MLELAKEQKQKVADLINLAKNMSIDVKNAMSSVTDEEAKKIVENIGKITKSVPKVIVSDEQTMSETVKVVEKTPEPTPTNVVKEKNVASVEKQENVQAQPLEIGRNANNFSNRRNDTQQGNQQNRNQGGSQGSYQNRNQGGGQGSYQNRNQGGSQGSYQNRNQGGGQGNYQNRNQGGQGNYQNRNQGGYQNRNQGGGQGNYQNRNQGGQGGYQNRNQGGGQGSYQNRNQGGQGSYQNRNQGGQGGYQNRNQGGGQGNYQNRNQGGQGGYQNRNQGGYQNRNQGGYQNRNQGNNNRGMDNRGIEKQLSDISASTEAQAKQSRNFFENKDRRNFGEEKKSKKQLKEERRLEDKKMAMRRNAAQQEVVRPDVPKVLKHKGTLTVGEISQQIGVTVADIIKYLLGLGIMATINLSLDADAIELIAAEYDAKVEHEEVVDETDLSLQFEIEEDENNLQSRPPVITIMGHVDHGKTTLLDTIRKTNVVGGEAGGITQHIGAYQIIHNGKKLTFLDTPGHEAFTSMRARGASITDVAIIVVAADDGVMPQTREAVEHAKAADVPIIVAVNKIDKPGADPTRVMQGLTELGLQPESWGGETIYCEISAKMGTGIENLIEMILLVSEVAELKANPDRMAFGTVVEARLDKGRGAVATLLVQGGTLEVGNPIVVGNTYGRVRTMENNLAKHLKTAEPSVPVEITGLLDVPSAGDQFSVFENEKKARQIGESRASSMLTERRRKSSAMSLEDLNQQILEGDIKDINVIVKADVQGSVEAVAQSFRKIDVQGVRVKIVSSGAGAISESDVMLALATNAIIYGFNVRPDANTRQVAESEGVEIRLHSIIYKAIEELEAAMNGMLDPEFEEKIMGQLEVRQLFKVSKIGTIAGCMVTSGEIKRDTQIRLIRDNIMIYEGKLGSLRREQDDVKTVAAGYECGITIDGYNDLKVDDVIETYEMVEIKK